MKVVIFAGGLGTRLSEYTDKVPKPMVPIGGTPILIHIMRYYARYGFKDFVIALGYKSEYVKSFFLQYLHSSSDLELDFFSSKVSSLSKPSLDWKVTLVDTGLSTGTAGRLLKLRPYLSDTFFLTYGDGLSDVDLHALCQHHETFNSTLTVTAVRPNARFGELQISDNLVTSLMKNLNSTRGGLTVVSLLLIQTSFLL